MESESRTAPAVLIAEDNAVIAMEVEERLCALGYRVVGVAANGHEAIEDARRLRPEILLFDIHLGGGLDGVEAAQRILAERPVPVVFLSAYSDEATLERVRAIEHASYLLKPFAERMLQILLDSALYRFRAAVEREAIERARRRSEARLAALLDNSPDAIISVGETGKIVVFNRGAEAMFGYTADEMIGRSLDVLIPPEVCDAHGRMVERFATSGVGARPMGGRREIVGLRRSGETFPAEATIFRVDIEPDLLLSVLMRDISERKRLEARTLAAQKLEAAGRLAAGVAHDFNNLLAVIQCNAYLASLNAGESPEAARPIDDILESVERGAALTRQMLAFVRREPSTPRLVDVTLAVRNMERLIRTLAGARIATRFELEVGAGVAALDVATLEQAMMNLVANARDAMPHGGTIHVRTRCVVLDAALATAGGSAAPGEYAEISVADTGTGMSPEVCARAAEPFFTTKPLGHGTGLGLASVAELASGHGGHLRLESVPGRGTEVRLLFPRASGIAQSVPPPATVERTSSTTASLSIGVLVVDDEDALRAATCAVLRHAGFAVHDAPHGAAAIEVLATVGPAISVVVADVVMPSMTGRDLVNVLRGRRPDLGFVLTSGHPTGDLLAADEPFPLDVLRKPFHVDELVSRVCAAARGVQP